MDFLLDEGRDRDRQVDAAERLRRALEEGTATLTDDLARDLERFVVRSLERLREDATEDARVRAGLAVRLAPFVPTARVRDRLLETLEVWFDRVAWPHDLFEAVRRVGLVEALPHFEEVLDRFGALDPDALARARFPYPIREAMRCAAALGGEAEAERIGRFLRPGVPPARRAEAADALGDLDGETSLRLLLEAARDVAADEAAPSWLSLSLGAALVRRDRPEGVALLARRLSRGPDLEARAWLEIACARPFADDREALAFVRDHEGEAPSALRRERWQAAGLTAADGDPVDVALAVLEAGRPLPERIAAWLELRRTLGRDPFGGRFLEFEVVTPGGGRVRTRYRPGAPLGDEVRRLLEERHRLLAERLRAERARRRR